ncbi:hypothetical protein [Streptacidiphilus melanogenes]|uniref:hypothetical protein n=1 Tax=Streptacidiphilus melanogenes TaxID=411235 RepID=UPI0005A8D939|nr:hypothetical protein [Streptacidiphilus melanogenes]
MDLRIAHTDPGALRDRCQITTLHPAPPGGTHEDGAVVPTHAWKPLPSTLARGLQPGPAVDHRTIVELVTLPDRTAPARFADLVTVMGDPRAEYVGHYTSPPKLATTTPNPANHLFVGVHVDNFDRLDYQAKHHGRRRLCLNLGPGTRHLLIGTVDIRTIARTAHRDHQRRYPHTSDLRTYVAEGRPIDVLRITLAPGEGYIAPTELLPHDGSTADADQASTAAFWLGNWPTRTLPWLI